ncbi:15753_t:CDS:1, partial [Gigaspora margarita]
VVNRRSKSRLDTEMKGHMNMLAPQTGSLDTHNTIESKGFMDGETWAPTVL